MSSRRIRLRVLGRVARTKETVVVTKRGRPLVEVIPFRHSDELPAGKIVGNTGVREGHHLAAWRIDLECLQVKYLLDTHVWVWWNMHPENRSRKVKGIIAASQKSEEILLSAISVWEFCKLLEKRRIGISCDPREWLETALAMPKLRLVPLSPVISYRSTGVDADRLCRSCRSDHYREPRKMKPTDQGRFDTSKCMCAYDMVTKTHYPTKLGLFSC